ncbi:MAG: phosphate signaling complex protein PhoU [Fibrobacter sp.]|nr:phosphate signaling complex protein PhoU [Fibrobacter sp.]
MVETISNEGSVTIENISVSLPLILEKWNNPLRERMHFFMKSHLELSVQRDVDRIKTKIAEMSSLAEQALKDCITILCENNRQLAYAVILRDQTINAKEKEIDRLCLEFMVRQQPVALPLRFAYSTIKINLEIERIGDYAESIARQLLKLSGDFDCKLKEGVIAIGTLSLSMFHDASQSFITQDEGLARKCIEVEQTVDVMRTELNELIKESFNEGKISLDQLDILMSIVRRFERVSDQARNICTEVLYMCTGEYTKHPGSEFFRVLFVDYQNSCLSQIAEAVALDCKKDNFIFSSAGVVPTPIHRETIDFMKSKGVDISRNTPKTIHQIPNLDHYQIIITLDEEARKVFPSCSPKLVILDWAITDPLKAGTAEERINAFEKVYTFIKEQINDLVIAVSGTKNK